MKVHFILTASMATFFAFLCFPSSECTWLQAPWSVTCQSITSSFSLCNAQFTAMNILEMQHEFLWLNWWFNQLTEDPQILFLSRSLAASVLLLPEVSFCNWFKSSMLNRWLALALRTAEWASGFLKCRTVSQRQLNHSAFTGCCQALSANSESWAVWAGLFQAI